MSDEKKPNSGHLHEIMDRSWLVHKTWSDFILTHSGLEHDPKLAEKANQIDNLLGEFYQESARLFFDLEEDEQLVQRVRDLAIRWLPGLRHKSTRHAWRHAEDVAKLVEALPFESDRERRAAMAVAWGHDLIEDGKTEAGLGVSILTLREAGVPPEIVRDIHSLTKTPGQTKEEYIDNVRLGPLRVQIVKCCDRTANLTEALTCFSGARWERYVHETLDWILPMAESLPELFKLALAPRLLELTKSR